MTGGGDVVSSFHVSPADLEDVTQVPGQLDIYGNEIGTPEPSWAEQFDIAEGTQP